MKPVGSAAGCHGTVAPFDALFDLSGNVWEWEHSCDGTTGSSDRCRLRGGAFNNYASYLTCGYGYNANRDIQFERGGFRCCGG